MRIIKNIQNLRGKLKCAVVTLGVFDGVHLAHQYIIRRVVNQAKNSQGTSVVLTFDPHPVKVLGKNTRVPLITSLNHRVQLIRDLGVDACVIVPFVKKFSYLSAEQFVAQILVRKIGVKRLVLGQDFRFGRNKKGSLALLEKLSQRYSFTVEKIKPLTLEGEVIRSSRIRTLLEKGQIRQANMLLGRPFSILGKVTQGKSRGRLLGYRTANIIPEQEVIPRRGVYAVRVKINGEVLPGMVNIGLRPTFDQKNDVVIEAHIFGFSKNIYRKKLEVFFVERIRSEKHFHSSRALQAQIRRDEHQAKVILHLSLLH
ncbi:MAG: bifunctional riboflavin kinase/FAD synthetase [Candidatus Omnitrophota bacterium]